MQQLALAGSSSSLHSEACNTLGASDGVIHIRISHEVVSLRATAANIACSVALRGRAGLVRVCVLQRHRQSITSSLGNAADLHKGVATKGVAAFVSRRTDPFQVNKGRNNRDASMWLPNVCDGTMSSTDM